MIDQDPNPQPFSTLIQPETVVLVCCIIPTLIKIPAIMKKIILPVLIALVFTSCTKDAIDSSGITFILFIFILYLWQQRN